MVSKETSQWMAPGYLSFVKITPGELPSTSIQKKHSNLEMEAQ